ncbi:DNA polymerase ligase N-terminal domain-containing protein [Mycobacterium kansasii]|uniref:DNA polymerase ligase N-terminal domain-containing protein n=1 Tax=Mycobacterium kansasii TaxID=1768 RepID=UPI000CDDF48F|nr:DNA polymerase ligase N-terminal domain-containing protein [Mycobacterium kansasii]POY30792.1 DNA ligase [Mycobacterium kansasii]
MQLSEYRRMGLPGAITVRRAAPGGRHRPKKLTTGKGPRFVIRHHVAHSDHYDLSLEIDGMLVCWAIPRSPSTDPKDKRMALRTEDHPVQYATFEAARGVIVWDHGTYANMTGHDMIKGLERGHLWFHLHGRTLRGGYALTRIREGEDETWLLTKRNDAVQPDARPKLGLSQPEAVLSGRTPDEPS